MIFAVIGIFAALGGVCYLQVYNALSKIYGEWMAFGTIVIFDVIWLIALLIFISMGKYGKPAAGTEDDVDQEELDLAGPDMGFGKYNDLPKLDNDQEIYDERILEADEEYEKSTRRGSLAPVIVKKQSIRGSLN